MTLQDRLINIEEKIAYFEYLSRINEGSELTEILDKLNKAEIERMEINSEILDRKLMGFV